MARARTGRVGEPSFHHLLSAESTMPSQRQCLHQLASLLIESERSLDAWLDALATAMPGKRSKELIPVINEVWHDSCAERILEIRELARRIRDHPRFVKWWIKGPMHLELQLDRRGQPAAVIDTSAWQLPAVDCIAGLARFLRLHPDDLGWLLSPLPRHYHSQWLAKRKGGRRLLESPKPLLKLAQRRLLHDMLDRVPPHESCHGFRTGHGVADFAAPHTHKSVVLRMDLADFFPRVGFRRVKRLFMALGYRETVATGLTRLCVSSTRLDSMSRSERELYQRHHLPQGAPTSPALANLSAFRFDCRLAGLARAAGGVYTRYADDLLFSGMKDSPSSVHRFEIQVMAIALEEGFAIQPRKTRRMSAAQCQSAAGMVLNEGINIRRRDFDALKAILTNCQRHGPASQNHGKLPDFAAHLRGRIEWVRKLNDKRGEKLLRLYRQVDWGNAV